ncbi:MAG: hypothetical protein R2759_00220 [Bacteroidales bacterium]
MSGGEHTAVSIGVVHHWETKVYCKRTFVAVIYVSGVWGGPWALSGFNISPDAVILFAVFMMLAIADVLVSTIYDHNTELADKHPTLSSAILVKKQFISFITC